MPPELQTPTPNPQCCCGASNAQQLPLLEKPASTKPRLLSVPQPNQSQDDADPKFFFILARKIGNSPGFAANHRRDGKQFEASKQAHK
jgi:hypothetical protein